jgi:transposase
MLSHLGLIFQHDNVGAHQAYNTQRELANRGITTMPWPPSSPDLNPIEAFWQQIKQRIPRHQERPYTVTKLQALSLNE